MDWILASELGLETTQDCPKFETILSVNNKRDDIDSVTGLGKDRILVLHEERRKLAIQVIPKLILMCLLELSDVLENHMVYRIVHDAQRCFDQVGTREGDSMLIP